jgi:hypothetical protein
MGEAKRVVAGLDCSSVCVGYAILSERREFLSLGHKVRHGDPDDFALEVAGLLKGQVRALEPCHISWAIETNDYPKEIKSKKGIRAYRLCRWMEGRILHILRVPFPMEIQADNKVKAGRRHIMELKFADQIQGHDLWYTSASKTQRKCLRDRNQLSRLTEDEIDALATADAAATKLFLDKVKSRA